VNVVAYMGIALAVLVEDVCGFGDYYKLGYILDHICVVLLFNF
jgi:hypothetical protein